MALSLLLRLLFVITAILLLAVAHFEGLDSVNPTGMKIAVTSSVKSSGLLSKRPLISRISKQVRLTAILITKDPVLLASLVV